MSKKNTVKLGLAAAVAASSLVAANPAQAAAASKTETLVKQAEAAVAQLKPYYSVTKADQVMVSAEFTAKYNAATKAVKAAQAAKPTGAWATKLAAAEQNRIKAARIIDAVKVGDDLMKKVAALDVLVKANKLDDTTVAAYNEVSKAVLLVERTAGKVYGAPVREAVQAKYVLPAKIAKETVIFEVSRYNLHKELKQLIADNKLDEVPAKVALLQRLEERSVKIKEAGNKLHPGMYPELKEINAALAKDKAEVIASYEAKLTPKVESVSAINGKQLVVKFNKAIDADTVITDAGTDDTLLSSVSVVADTDAESVTAAKLEGALSKDGKTLTITSTDVAEFFDGTYTVTATDAVKTTDAKALTPFIAKVTVDDTTAPTVTGVSYDAASDEVTLTLSEALVGNPDVLRVNGTPVAFTNSSTGPVTELTFNRPASVATGSVADIYIAGAKDYKGNALAAYTGNVTFTKDVSALGVASVTQADSDTLRVVFNKKLGAKASSTTLADLAAAITVLKDGSSFPYSVSATAGDTTGTSFDLNFTSTNLYGTAADKDLALVIAKDGLVDVYGNKNAASSQNVKMTKDVVAPTVTGTSVSSDKKTITLTFSEGVTVDDSLFTVRRDGIAVNTTGLTIVSDSSDNKKVTIKNADASAFTAGNYTFRLEAGAVKDLVEANKNALVTASAVVSAGTTTGTDLLAAVSTPANNKFEVAFSDNSVAKEVTADTALNLANYKLDGKALPTGTDIYFKDANKDTVVIVLPAGSVNIGAVGTGSNAILSVAGVKSTTGKTVASTGQTVKVEDNTAATLTGASKVGNSVIVTFSEAISGTKLDAADFVVTDATGTTVGTSGYATSTVAGNSKQVQLTFTAIPSGAITVKTSATGTVNLTDANGLVVAAGSQVVSN
ncbi:hypothetical protein CEF21_21135 [Bacillus sp. FJAT-42376]|uniref:hypothetical protein n=1 Tax=Bacillus sp. FJAT-42376 TaxID=2014076 RepID=UPI000F4D8403|nr:hypothetical protein [Bacillus sp. FJAT-42376]AZB44587.1 hypothetical protein CEF21_21135 [Bacillus sp. FJAT-42376]